VADPPAPAPTAHGRARRAKIVASAAELIARNGYHAVGVADIGAAAGVTGAALYRHFDTKASVLAAVFDQAVDGLLDGAQQTVGHGTAREQLDALVRAHVEFALRDRAVLAVYSQELHQLPEPDQRRLRRKQRRYVELVTDVLTAQRSDLDRRAALVRVEATFGLLNAVPNLTRVSDNELRAELRAAALGALLAEAG
jgi:AcrR family transcriptional regulator